MCRFTLHETSQIIFNSKVFVYVYCSISTLVLCSLSAVRDTQSGRKDLGGRGNRCGKKPNAEKTYTQRTFLVNLPNIGYPNQLTVLSDV